MFLIMLRIVEVSIPDITQTVGLPDISDSFNTNPNGWERLSDQKSEGKFQFVLSHNILGGTEFIRSECLWKAFHPKYQTVLSTFRNV